MHTRGGDCILWNWAGLVEGDVLLHNAFLVAAETVGCSQMCLPGRVCSTILNGLIVPRRVQLIW